MLAKTSSMSRVEGCVLGAEGRRGGGGEGDDGGSGRGEGTEGGRTDAWDAPPPPTDYGRDGDGSRAVPTACVVVRTGRGRW